MSMLTVEPKVMPETTPKELQPSGPEGFPPALPPDEPARPSDVTPIPDVPSIPIPPAIPSPAYRFASQDEAEKAELAAKTRMHQATQEAADYRKKLADLELVRDTRSTEEYLASATQAMHKELRAIPSDDPDLATKEVAVLLKYQTQNAQRIAESVMQKERAQSLKDVEDRVQSVRQTEAVEQLITTRLKTEGLTQPDHRLLFDTVLQGVKSRTTDFATLTTEEQFRLVLDPMRTMLGMTAEQLKSVADKTAEAKREAEVLGRGGVRGVSADTPAKPTTLGEQIKQVAQDKSRQFKG